LAETRRHPTTFDFNSQSVVRPVHEAVKFIAEALPNSFHAAMSMLPRQLARYAARKAASDLEARENMIKASRGVVGQSRRIAGEDDRAYAAGRAFRKALDKLQSKP
jgi:hypothetical protein